MERSGDYRNNVLEMESKRNFYLKISNSTVIGNLKLFSDQLFKNIKNGLTEVKDDCLTEEKSSDAEFTYSYKKYEVTVKNDGNGNIALYFYPQRNGENFDQRILFSDDDRNLVCHMDTISIIPVWQANSLGQKIIGYDIQSNNSFLKDYAVNADINSVGSDEPYYAIFYYITNKINSFVNVSPFSKEGYLIKNFYNDSLFEK